MNSNRAHSARSTVIIIILNKYKHKIPPTRHLNTLSFTVVVVGFLNAQVELHRIQKVCMPAPSLKIASETVAFQIEWRYHPKTWALSFSPQHIHLYIQFYCLAAVAQKTLRAVATVTVAVAQVSPHFHHHHHSPALAVVP